MLLTSVSRCAAPEKRPATTAHPQAAMATTDDDVSCDKFEQHFRAVDVALAVAEASTALLERSPSNHVRDRAEAAWNRALLVIRDYRDYIC